MSAYKRIFDVFRFATKKTLALAGYGSIGVNLQIRPRNFATQIVITLTSIAP